MKFIAVITTGGATPEVVIPYMRTELNALAGWLATTLGLQDQGIIAHNPAHRAIARLYNHARGKGIPTHAILRVPDNVQAAAQRIRKREPVTIDYADAQCIADFISELEDTP